MKHLLKLTLLLLAVMLPALASAHDIEVDGIYYNVNGNEAIVTYRGYSYDSYSNEYVGAVNIPSSVTYGGRTYTVTSIGYAAFYGCSELICVTIPNYIASIGDWAFYGCSSLGTVIWNAVNCVSIGSNAFNYSLSTLQFGNSVEHIPAGMPSFSGYRLVLPNSVKTIAAGAFTSRWGWGVMVIGDNIENIASGAFPSNISSVYVSASEPQPCEEGAFVNPGTLYVPVGSRMSYFVSPGWSEFSNIVEGTYVRASYIVLNQSNITMTRGTTQQLNATVLPNNASTTYATWLSQNPSIATVNSNGVITAVAVGETDIVAMVDNVRAICHVRVTPVLVDNLTLSDTLLTLEPGDMQSLTATILPNDADNQALEWIIPENDVIVSQVVNNTRLNLGAVGLGSVPITVQTTDGSNLSASCIVNVLQNPLSGEITFTQGGVTTEVFDGYEEDADIITSYEYLDICYTGSEEVWYSIKVGEIDLLSDETEEQAFIEWKDEINGYRIYLKELYLYLYIYEGDGFLTSFNFNVTVHANEYNNLFNSAKIKYCIPGLKPEITDTYLYDYSMLVGVKSEYSRIAILVNGEYENLWYDEDHSYDSGKFYVAKRLNDDYEITVRALGRNGSYANVYYVGDEMTLTVPAINNGISMSLSDSVEQNSNPTTKKYLRLHYYRDIGDSKVSHWNVIINGNPIEVVNDDDENYYFDIVNIDLSPYEGSYGGNYFVQATATVYDHYTGNHEVYAEEHFEYYFPIPAPTISSYQTNDAVIIDVVSELSERKLKVDGVEVDELPYSMPRLDHDYYTTIQAGCSPDGERWAWSEEEIILIPAKVAVSTLLGDVNSDNLVNISDITALIDYLLSGNDSAISLTNADCNGNGAVNIADVVELIDYLLSGHWPEPEPTPVITTFTANGVAFDMVEVEGGTFMMGGTPEQGDEIREREKPVHQVTLSSFNIGQTEVTQELWQAVMADNPSYHTGDLKRPVERVSWVDCQEFISKLNQLTGKSFRLPTEAEWEYAARGGNKSKGYRYAGGNDMNEVSWYIDNSSNTTHPVGTKAPNELSLYDMTGNVWEWTNDWFKLYTADPQVNPTGPATGNNRVLRGGCWNGDASYNRIAYRDNFTPTGNNSSGGLRLVLDVDNNSKFSLSETVVKVQVGWTNSVFILNGGGNYTVAGGTDYATASINGNKLIVTGTALGTTTVCVTDAATGATAVLTVIVTESTLHEEEFTVNGVTFKMITIDGGTYTMGATEEQGSEYYGNERPTHQVRLSSYKIGQTEVTQKLWQAVMGSNPSNCTGDLQRPVEKVSWNDCQTFITRLNQLTGKSFRLPTEAEWEFASRGGNLSQGYKFAGSNTLDDVAWFYDNSDNTTHPVGTKTPNELGLYDMSGNVFEWCQDWFGDYSVVAQTNPTGPTTGTYRVVRGGAWNYSAKYCRLSYRSYHSMTSTYDRIGLRLALD